MATKKETTPIWSIEDSPDWEGTFALLRKRRYEQVAKFLYQTRLLSEQADNAIMADTLAAALHICWACRQFKAEITLHRQTYEELIRRERDLTQLLQAILDQISGRGMPESPEDRTVPPLVLEAGQNPLEVSIPAAEKPNFLQRIQSLLGWGESSQSPEWAESTSSVKALASAPGEEFEVPVTTSSEDKPETSIQPAIEKTEVPPQPSVAVVEEPTMLAIEKVEIFRPPTAAETEKPTVSSTEEAELPTLYPAEKLDVPAKSPPQEAKPAATLSAQTQKVPTPTEVEETEEAEEPTLSPSRKVEELAIPCAEKIETPVPPSVEKAQEAPVPPSLVVYCLGPFRVYQSDQSIAEWSSLKGQSILKYLALHKGGPVAKDILMDVFWPDADPGDTRRNLHQAIYSLRQTLRGGQSVQQPILFKKDCYLLNPEMVIWLDSEEFKKHGQAGRRLETAGQLAEAMVEYSIAEGLYQGDLLEEDLYEDWPRWQREQLRNLYLDIANRLSEYYVQRGEYAAAIALCQKTLAKDNCYEEAYRRLMHCYLAQGQRHLAVRQYQTCVQALKEGLDLTPSEETVVLYQHLIIGV